MYIFSQRIIFVTQIIIVSRILLYEYEVLAIPLFNIICAMILFLRPEGKAALSCLIGYIKDCPELEAMMSAAGAGGGGGEGMPDMKTFLNEDSLDLYCSMHTGTKH